MAAALDWSARVAEMEALLTSRQRELEQQLGQMAALEADVDIKRGQQEAALLKVLQLKSRHADASLQLAQLDTALSDSQEDSKTVHDIVRLEERHSRLQRQAEAMRQAQQREQELMSEFAAVAEDHVSAAATPLPEARQALDQVRKQLQEQQRAARPAASVEAEAARLDVDAAAVARDRQAAGLRLEEVQAENRALQRLINDQREANKRRTEAHQQAAGAEVAKMQALRHRLDKVRQESVRLRADEQNLDHKLAECKAELLELSNVSC